MNVAVMTVLDQIVWIEEEAGILAIASFLRAHGHKVLVIEEKHDDVDVIIQQLKEFQPDVIGVTVYDDTSSVIEEVMRVVRKEFPNAYLSAGGYTATYSSETLLKNWDFLDVVMRGEGEYTFLEWLDHIKNGTDLDSIAGISYMKDGQIIHNPDRERIENLDELPYMARDLLGAKNRKSASISVTRGCNRACAFCSSPKHWKRWRGRTSKKVVDEIEAINKEEGVEFFNFNDNSIEDPDGQYDRFIDIAQEIVDRNLSIYYKVNTRIESVRLLTREKMEILKKSGLCMMFVGVESSNEEDLILFNKKHAGQYLDEAIANINRSEIRYFIGYINFNPYSTIEGLKKNITWLHDNGYAFYFRRLYSSYQAYKGHALLRKLQQDDLIVGNAELGPYEYRFQHPEVGRLYNAVKKYFTDMNHRLPSYEKVNFLSREWAYYDLAYLERYLLNHNETGELQIFQEEKKKVDEILNELNEYNYQWFYEMLTMISEGERSEEELIDWLKERVKDEAIELYASKLNIAKIHFYRKIMRKNPSLEKQLL